MDISTSRANPVQLQRTDDLIDIIPKDQSTLLEIGARDGYISNILTGYFDSITALDLEKPNIQNEKVENVQGDVTTLQFTDNSFDIVLCAEVLEHIPPALLSQACNEITRTAKNYAVIGVPFNQDIRVGRTTCQNCSGKNPPWGHVNSFDKAKLINLFSTMNCIKTTYIGTTNAKTNPISCILMDLAGNPGGTYSQEEPCIFCGATLSPPIHVSLIQKNLNRVASLLRRTQQRISKPQANWIHMVFEKNNI